MIIVLIVFLIASIINWRIARKRQAHCWRDESSRRKNQKKTIFVVIRSNVDTTPIEAVVPVGCIFWIIYLGLHFFLGDGFFARGIDRNLIRVKK